VLEGLWLKTGREFVSALVSVRREVRPTKLEADARRHAA
jgi:hypothetical protein